MDRYGTNPFTYPPVERPRPLPRTMPRPSVQRLAPGRYELKAEGWVDENGRFRSDNSPSLSFGPDMTSLSLRPNLTRLPDPAPKWRPGDVVVVSYGVLDGVSYTYVRGAVDWPGDRRAKTDEQMTELFQNGKLRPVLQAGGEPFDRSRIPS